MELSVSTSASSSYHKATGVRYTDLLFKHLVGIMLLLCPLLKVFAIPVGEFATHEHRGQPRREETASLNSKMVVMIG